MFKAIADPADNEVRSAIRFSNAWNVNSAEIHCQLVEIYVENVMSGKMGRKWARQFNDGHTNVHDDIRNGQPFVVRDGLD
ncbi:HTH_48 domain-containing protein [Trichonephila clavipes]|nr:HTH_48 domain-containing protein [Trichonephila clavipes]